MEGAARSRSGTEAEAGAGDDRHERSVRTACAGDQDQSTEIYMISSPALFLSRSSTGEGNDTKHYKQKQRFAVYRRLNGCRMPPVLRSRIRSTVRSRNREKEREGKVHYARLQPKRLPSSLWCKERLGHVACLSTLSSSLFPLLQECNLFLMNYPLTQDHLLLSLSLSLSAAFAWQDCSSLLPSVCLSSEKQRRGNSRNGSQILQMDFAPF